MEKRYLLSAIATAVAIVLIQAAIGVSAYFALPDWASRGQFGDIFGAANALFSGLAFAGLIYAILLQREDLALQRRELELTRQELKRTAAAQEHQLLAMKNGSTAQNVLSLVNFLQQLHVRDARRVVRETLKNIPYKDWTEEQKRAADTVCANYDIAAILIFEQQLVPSRPFVTHWAASIRDCYEILLPRIYEMQKAENSGADYWSNFGELYTAVTKRTEG